MLPLEEFVSEIIHKKIHNLEYNPKLNTTNEYTHATLGVSSEEMSVQQWKSLAHHWQSYYEGNASTQAHCIRMNEVFANCREEDEIYPLTTMEIAEAQQADATLKHLFKLNAVIDQGLRIRLIDNTTCVCKDGWLVMCVFLASGYEWVL
jgi:hypothetical protein